MDSNPVNRRTMRKACTECSGTGVAETTSEKNKCGQCRGVGYFEGVDRDRLCDACLGLGEVNVERPVSCENCEGKGYRVLIVEDQLRTCRRCDGFKRVYLDGSWENEDEGWRTCEVCSGTGKETEIVVVRGG